MSSFDDFLKEQMNNPEIKAEHDALEPEFAGIQAGIEERKGIDLKVKIMELNRRERDSSIELLRIIAIIGVLILHYNHEDIGGALSFVQQGSLNHYYLLFSKTVFMCAVNVMIIISAYFLSATQERRFVKVVELFIQLTAFRLAFYFASALTGGQELSFDMFFRNLLPKNYFVLLYCCLYIVSPYINIVCSRLSRKSFGKLLVTLFVLFSVWDYLADFLVIFYGSFISQLSTVGMYGGQQGYTIVHFIVLYFIGAYIRRFESDIHIKHSGAAVLISLLLLFALVVLEYRFLGTIDVWQYNSPFMIMYSAFVFLFFRKIRFSSKIVNELAGAVFTCYLFHIFLIERVNTRAAAAGSLGFLVIHQLLSAAAMFIASYIAYKIYGLCSGWFIKLITPLCNKVPLTVKE